MKRKSYSTNLGTIYLGDCLELLKEIESESVDLVITDPPYAKKYLYLWEPLFKESERILKPRGNFISLLGHYSILEVGAIGEKYLRFWWPLWMTQSKLNRLIGKGVAVKGKPALWFLKERRRDIREYGYPFDTLKSDLQEDNLAKEFHEWGQSVSWFAHYINELTKENELVVDPFMGSGSVALACEKLNRRWIGMEINEKDYNTIVERLCNESS